MSSVTLHVGDQAGSGSQALLTAAGLISKLPFKVDWSDFTSGPPMLQAMGSGAIDIGSVGDAPPVFAAAGGEKVAIVGAVTAGPNASAIVVPDNSPIHSVAQLKGKRIAVAQGSSADYHLLTVLNKAHLSVHDVSLDYLQPADGLAALTSGHVDAWDIWSPYIEQVVGQDHARILVNGTGYGAPYSFAVASRAALADPAKAAAIRDYLKLLNQAYVWGGTHVSAWAAVWAKATGLPDSVMLKAAKDDMRTPVPITPAVISAEQSVSNAFTTAGLIPGHVDFTNFSDSGFNDTVGGSSWRSRSTGSCPPPATAGRSWAGGTACPRPGPAGRPGRAPHIRGAAAQERPPDIEYLAQVARSAEQLGFEAVLTPTGTWCEDAWLVTAALTRETSRLKFLVAFRPGLTSPTLAAQMAATYQRLSGGRLLLNVVTGGQADEQRRFGDYLSHDERYARTGEFLAIVRGAWTGEPFDFHGEHYQVEGATVLRPPDPVPGVYFGGSSPAAGAGGRLAPRTST